MNVLLIYYEPQVSGQTAHVLSLVRGLEPHHAVTVVLPEQLGGAADMLRESGARVVPLPLRKVRWPPRAVLGLWRLLREGPWDVVHVHSLEAGLLARGLARLGGARAVVYTPQTIDIRRARWQGVYARVERVLALVTDAIVSVNAADRERLIAWGITPGKVVTVPNGIDLAEFDGLSGRDEARRALGLPGAGPLVVQLGRLSEQKDPETFVAGAALVLRDNPDARFVLLGDGPLRERAAGRVRELGLERCVYLLGWRPDARRLLPAADVVTLTSRWEGAPYAVLEAMACSRPVVATAVNGCPEIVLDGVTGCLVPPGDPAAWAAAVSGLLRSPEQARAMGAAGRRRVEDNYTTALMIARIGDLYRRLDYVTRRRRGK